MNQTFIITGTDTGIGKTVFAAALTQALQATYWKPVQAGLADETDRETVARLSGQKVLPETYRLTVPASPHLAAEKDGVEIDIDTLIMPPIDGPLVIEGAGGLMVPLNRSSLYLDVFARWGAPVILCACTSLGTINHSLLSLQALKKAGCPIWGIAFIGESEPAVETTIVELGGVNRLGRLAPIDPLTPATLARAFAEGFNLDNFKGVDR